MSCPPPIACEEVVPMLWELIDGELEPGRAERVRQHLTVCDGCLAQYEFQSAFVGMLARQRVGTAPPQLRRRIVEQILRERSDETPAE